jgi:diguanylate cyclase (GGDEF)-like protein
MKRAKRHRRDLGCILFDLDRFKSVNDTYGHAVGDKVLREVIAVCRSELRASDHICRLGGEEFAVLLPDTGAEVADVAEGLREKIAALAVAHGAHLIRVSASFGVAVLSDKDADVKDVMARADAAVRQAKAGGRDEVVEANVNLGQSPSRAA